MKIYAEIYEEIQKIYYEVDDEDLRIFHKDTFTNKWNDTWFWKRRIIEQDKSPGTIKKTSIKEVKDPRIPVKELVGGNSEQYIKLNGFKKRETKIEVIDKKGKLLSRVEDYFLIKRQCISVRDECKYHKDNGVSKNFVDEMRRYVADKVEFQSVDIDERLWKNKDFKAFIGELRYNGFDPVELKIIKRGD